MHQLNTRNIVSCIGCVGNDDAVQTPLVTHRPAPDGSHGKIRSTVEWRETVGGLGCDPQANPAGKVEIRPEDVTARVINQQAVSANLVSLEISEREGRVRRTRQIRSLELPLV